MKQQAIQIQRQVAAVKQVMTAELSKALSLIEIQAPLIVPVGSGLQDNLSGIEQSVKVNVKAENADYEVVHSLAKWKRSVLGAYDFTAGDGVVTHMLALRPDEDSLGPLHSVLVEQWDWEQVITEQQRCLATLKDRVQKIYQALKQTATQLKLDKSALQMVDQVTFITAEQLLQKYPTLTAKQREQKITEKYKAVFIIGIGGTLSHGEAHDSRSPDYDDWSSPNEMGGAGLNGDLLVWHQPLQRAVELSSMGIRVDATALQRQVQLREQSSLLQQPWHQQLLRQQLPQTIGGGIGQSRVALWLLQLDHIKWVQAPTVGLRALEAVA